jgi:hypothetical protein
MNQKRAAASSLVGGVTLFENLSRFRSRRLYACVIFPHSQTPVWE